MMDLNRHAADDRIGDVRGIKDTYQRRERGLLRRFYFVSQPMPLLVEEEPAARPLLIRRFYVGA
jgi:hypothetical protein